MKRTRVLAYLTAFIIVLCLASSTGVCFIGVSVPLNLKLGNTINVDAGKNIGVGNTAFGVGDMDVGVTWGVDCDLGTAAGYPYGYGGIGAVTQGGLGYNLGLSIDSTSGGGFNGAGYGIPEAEQGITTTHYGQEWSNEAALDSTQAVLPFTSFPVM